MSTYSEHANLLSSVRIEHLSLRLIKVIIPVRRRRRDLPIRRQIIFLASRLHAGRGEAVVVWLERVIHLAGFSQSIDNPKPPRGPGDMPIYQVLPNPPYHTAATSHPSVIWPCATPQRANPAAQHRELWVYPWRQCLTARRRTRGWANRCMLGITPETLRRLPCIVEKMIWHSYHSVLPAPWVPTPR